MSVTLSNLDWSLVQAFLAVAETGSLSGAARVLGMSQPTIGRHIQSMEDTFGVALFHRQARGMALTDFGKALLAPARAMQDAAAQLAQTAAGGSTDLTGTVRITASLFVSHHVLPPVLAEMRASYPDIQLDLVASDQSENLLFREADIAVRMYRPRQLDMVTRHIGSVPLSIFAAHSYLQRRGRPSTIEEFLTHDFVGYDRNEDIIKGFRDAGMHVDRSFFPVRTDNQTVYWELVRAGCGIGFSHRSKGPQDPSIEELILPIDIPPLEVWLTAHEKVRQSPRVARIWAILADRLSEHCDTGLSPS